MLVPQEKIRINVVEEKRRKRRKGQMRLDLESYRTSKRVTLERIIENPCETYLSKLNLNSSEPTPPPLGQTPYIINRERERGETRGWKTKKTQGRHCGLHELITKPRAQNLA